MIRFSVPFALVIALILTGCSDKKETIPPPPPMKVGAMAVDRGPITIGLQVSGMMKFAANTTLSAEVSAQVESIEVEDGQLVAAGQILLKLDQTKIKEAAEQASANLKRDEASLSFSRSELERNKGLFESGSVSHSVYEQKLTAYQNAVSQVDADRALLARAREDLKKTQVTSPVSGVLSKRYVEKGDWVSEGKRLFQISDYQRIYLEAFITDLDVGKLSVKKIRSEGENAEVTLDAYPGETFSGRLTYIEPVANDNRLFEIRIYVKNADMRLLQGMVGRGRIVVKTVPDVLRVPVVGLLNEIRTNTDNTVYSVDRENRAQLSQIKIGEINHAYGAVLEGLSEGNLVVVQGKEVLSSGQLLAITMLPNPSL
ncbi:MAG: efflux RND transporter periplasmic adaptor subunit [Deltaproteobacteria bacterium]|nr:efflux RND transporter periplasmic adaptor subunit [Deltaproteobacteria bacterium]